MSGAVLGADGTAKKNRDQDSAPTLGADSSRKTDDRYRNARVHITWGIVSVAAHDLGPHKGATHTLRKKRLGLANPEE